MLADGNLKSLATLFGIGGDKLNASYHLDLSSRGSSNKVDVTFDYSTRLEYTVSRVSDHEFKAVGENEKEKGREILITHTPDPWRTVFAGQVFIFGKWKDVVVEMVPAPSKN